MSTCAGPHPPNSIKYDDGERISLRYVQGVVQETRRIILVARPPLLADICRLVIRPGVLVESLAADDPLPAKLREGAAAQIEISSLEPLARVRVGTVVYERSVASMDELNRLVDEVRTSLES